jgi:penicillin-binding protein 1A
MMRVVVGNRRRVRWWRLPLMLAAWASLAIPIVVAVVVVGNLRAWSRDLPSMPDVSAWARSAPTTSRIVARDGTVLAELPFFDGAVVGRRDYVRLSDIPPIVVDAVLAAEDVRFFSHHGVDYPAMVRAAWSNLRAGRTVSGASTITQQLARNLSPRGIGTERSLRRKLREALVARR